MVDLGRDGRDAYRFPPAVVLFLAVVLLSGCAGPARVAAISLDGRPTIPVYVINHGWHTGVVIDRDRAAPWLPALRGRFAEARYLEFGWGEAAFYQADKPSGWLAMQAALGAGDSAMHVHALPTAPSRYYLPGEIVALKLSPSAFRALVEFIDASFYRNDEGAIVELSENQQGDSRFYRAVGRYHLFYTCNNWTAQALQSAGLPIDSATAQTAGAVMRSVERVALEPMTP